MASCTTLRLGGPADLLAEPAGADEIRILLREAADAGIPVTVIGRGSNLLVRDGGIRGLVIRIGRGMRAITRDADTLTAEAGASLAELARAAAENSLDGLAFAAGIPGTVGGGLVMNAGAYGGELGDVCAWVEGLRDDGTPVRYTAEEMDFAYRHSRLQAERVIVTRAAFRLTPGDRAAIEAVMADLAARRNEKQPLNLPSAGSAFKRPEGYFAAALIDQCGLKGFAVGGAQVSEKHAGFLVNTGKRAADFEQLMREVQRIVQEKTGVRLEPEIRILGEAAEAEGGA